MVRMRGGGVGRRRREPLEQIPDVDLYFLMESDKENWYCIKPGDYTYGSQILEPVLPQLPRGIHAASFASIGSVVYASGGVDRSGKMVAVSPYRLFIPPRTNKVFYIDTNHPERGWTAAPPMNANRLQHIMVADAGKMYVLGGLRLRSPPDPTDGKRIYAEVYDPLNSSAGWNQLAHVSNDVCELPQTIYGHGVVEEHKDHLVNRKIIFHSYNHMGLYGLGTNNEQFGFYDPKFGQFHTASTFLDGVLYFLRYDSMYAYDTSTFSGEPHYVVLCDVKTNTLPYRGDLDEFMPLAKLQSLGNGHLALVWVSDSSFGEFVDVYCSIIKMLKEGDLFVGNVLTCSTYSVQRGRLQQCMVVCSSKEDVSMDVEPAKISTKRANEDIGLDAERARITKWEDGDVRLDTKHALITERADERRLESRSAGLEERLS